MASTKQYNVFQEVVSASQVYLSIASYAIPYANSLSKEIIFCSVLRPRSPVQSCKKKRSVNRNKKRKEKNAYFLLLKVRPIVCHNITEYPVKTRPSDSKTALKIHGAVNRILRKVTSM
jgi:hypothetical protein